MEEDLKVKATELGSVAAPRCYYVGHCRKMVDSGLVEVLHA